MTEFVPTSSFPLYGSDAAWITVDLDPAVENSTMEPDYVEWNETTTATTDDEPYDIAFELPFLMTVCILGFVGNSLVIMVYSKRKFRRSNAALYILNLAATDFMALIIIVFHVTEFYPSTWPTLWAHNLQCQIGRFFRYAAFNSTVITMVAIAIDRYFAVHDPVGFKTKFTITRTKVILGIVWSISFLAAIPAVFMFESIIGGESLTLTYPGKLPWACKIVLPPGGPWVKYAMIIYLNIILFYVPVIITSIIYVLIVIHVRRSTLFLRKSLASAGAIPVQARDAHWKTAKSLLCVFVVFLICFLPFTSIGLQGYFAAKLHPELKNLSLLLPYFNSCLNPVVYSFTNDTFRRAVIQILQRGQRKPNTSEISTTSTKLGPNPSDTNQLRVSAPVMLDTAKEDKTDMYGIAFSYDRSTVSLDRVDTTPSENPALPE